MAPINVKIRGDSFRNCGRKGSWEGRRYVQLIRAPPIIAPKVRIIIGVLVFVSLSVKGVVGRLILGDQIAVIIRRIEYAAVIEVAKKYREIIMKLLGLNRSISIIRSFE